MRFNTAISQLMIFTNALEKASAVSREAYQTLLRLLAPFAPHVTEELWGKCGKKQSIHTESWPVVSSALEGTAVATIVIQVNGKKRAILQLKNGATEGEVREAATALPEVKKWLGESTIRKVIHLPNKLMNIVVD